MSDATAETTPPPPQAVSLDQLTDGLGETAKAQKGKQDMDAVARDIAGLQTQVKEMTAESGTLKKQIEKLQKQRDELETHVATLSEMKAKAEENQTTIASIENEIAENKKRIEETARLATESQQAAKTAEEKVVEAQKHVSEQAASIREQLGTLTTEKETLVAEITDLRKERDSLQTLLAEIKQFRTSAEEEKTSVSSDVQAITQTKQQFDEMKNQAQAVRDELAGKQSEVASKIAEINTAYDRVTQQQSTLFDDKTSETGATTRSTINQIHDANVSVKSTLDDVKRDSEASKKSLADLISTAKTDVDNVRAEFSNSLQKLIQQSTDQVQQLKASLERDIRALLPGAGAAGLAGAYVDAKARYSPKEFVYSGNSSDKFFWLKMLASWIIHAIRSYGAPLLFYVMFLAPLVFIVYYFNELLQTLKDHPQDFNRDLWLFRGFLSVPLATISLFGWSSIRLYRRLYEEYNHKQRVMQLYYSFKDEISQLGGEELQKALLAVMLTAVQDKPSLAMHRYDKGVEDVWPNFSLGEFFSALLKTAKKEKTE